ncbi:MAG: SDR family oxidoreductase [Myxococcota bacterium]|nr:short-chain dehydrogenase [Deltaproteobacteria bacterium]MCP4240136.1 SDR family oxidoreductase [bacterium]MDP6076157.1 SDR family oxidoreductase [Myxococcota bacterium]MDP6243086.1 SDR family oxidoreductase [Myxococcota bacterium]MDP7073495.1 SDR family oxidoreductase [Myxococcota bacterium]
MADELRFDGRVVLVTGAGGGLGAEYAKLLAQRGARVVVNDIGGVDAEAQEGASAAGIVAQIEAAGGEAVADTHSVATADGGRAMVAHALEHFGRLDAVVNNAGIGRTGSGFSDISDEQLDLVLRTHLYGAFHVLRPAWRIMCEQGYGRVVNTASSTAIGVDDSWDYPAAKGGVVSLTRCLAITGEHHDIKVNAIMPLAYTPMSAQVPSDEIRGWMKRTFPAETVAPTVALLCHEAAPCTGEIFSVGAGRTARVTYAVVPGFKTREPTMEALRDNWSDVLDTEGLVLAGSGAVDAGLFGVGFDDLGTTRMASDSKN